MTMCIGSRYRRELEMPRPKRRRKLASARFFNMLSSSICLASPDQGAIFSTLSIGDADAGINFGRTGVCHQIANRILMPMSIDCHDVRGYVRSLLIYGTYGARLWPEQSKCIIMDDRKRSIGLAEDSAPFWTPTDEKQSSDEMRGSDKQLTGLTYGLEEAYARYGYERRKLVRRRSKACSMRKSAP